jgi:nucleobase transporter 1/2
LAGIFGTGNGTTSYSENIGAISVTKVGSRRVIQAAGILMILFSLVGKVGAVFISIPEPIIGGIFCIVFATVTAVGLSNLQGVNLNASRNIFIIGFSIFFGLTISQWVEGNKGVINTGVITVDQIITVLLRTGMFVSGFLGFMLDNTIPGMYCT